VRQLSRLFLEPSERRQREDKNPIHRAERLRDHTEHFVIEGRPRTSGILDSGFLDDYDGSFRKDLLAGHMVVDQLHKVVRREADIRRREVPVYLLRQPQRSVGFAGTCRTDYGDYEVLIQLDPAPSRLH